jgi:hypothetical protein
MEGRDRDRPNSGALARFLKTELRLPLSTLARLGDRLSERDGELKAVGRALARECQRLDVLVTNALEFGLVAEPIGGSGGDIVLSEALEKAISSQRAWIEANQVRLRVLDSSREAVVSGSREAFLAGLFALFSDVLERLPEAATVVVRLRDVAGIIRVDIDAPGLAEAASFERPGLARMRALVLSAGGEFWSDAEGALGFALPRAGARLAVRRTRVGAEP